MEKIKTVLHAYYFDISKTEQQAAYLTTVEKIRAQFKGEAWTTQYAGYYHLDKNAHEFTKKIDEADASRTGCEIELETAHMFDDQWNSAPFAGFEQGARLFNWAENIYPNRHIKQGYWLEQTPAMAEVLRNTLKCGFCGKQEPAQKGYVFCPHCLGSAHLTPKQLHLTRLAPVYRAHEKRAELSDAERAHLLPLYKEAQLHGSTERDKARIAKARRDIETEFERTVAKATEKRDAARWLIDRVPQALENWIFYDHTKTHCFGWREPVAAELLSALLDVLSEFPFKYEIKCADGRTLENYAEE
jgi:hypothetical protein